MSPPAAIIVTAVVLGAGVAFVFTKHVWPHVQPQAEDLLRRLSEHRQRRREMSHSYSSLPHDNDDGQNDEFSKHAEGRSPSVRGQDSDFLLNTGGLRQRSNLGASSVIPNEKLLDLEVEMVNLDKPRTPALSYMMTPSSTRPSSRGPTYVDDNPFIEPSVPVAVAIPLPLSPSSSILAETTPSVSTSHLPSMHSRGASPFTPPSTQQVVQTPPQAPSPGPPAPSQHYTLAAPVAARSARHTHNPSSSQSSFGMLGPAPMSATNASMTAGGTIRSPAVRATSPAGMSDSMMSMVSAAPSRNWTDGGTADIFSGSEHDFRDGQSEDDDVRSVSDSGSWEDVPAHVGSLPGPGIGRP